MAVAESPPGPVAASAVPGPSPSSSPHATPAVTIEVASAARATKAAVRDIPAGSERLGCEVALVTELAQNGQALSSFLT